MRIIIEPTAAEDLHVGDRILQVTIDTYNQTFDVIDWMLDSPEFEYMGRAQPST